MAIAPDYPHLAGYDAAYKIFAPYPEIMECGSVPSWIREKTIYSLGFSRYSNRVLSKDFARQQLNISPQQQVVLVLNGKGGAKHSLNQVAKAASTTPDWLWLIVGEVETGDRTIPNNVRIVGWCNDTYIYLKAADAAIASGGHNTVMEIGTARLPFICIPESRPFDEQKMKAQRLQDLGLCLVRENFPLKDLEYTFQRLKEIDTSRWDEIMAVDAAADAANAIESEVKLLAGYLERTLVNN